RVSLNQAQATLGADGSFRVVLAHRDPGVPNWISTAGRREGLVFCRWLQADELPPQPTSEVMTLDSLRRGGRLPARRSEASRGVGPIGRCPMGAGTASPRDSARGARGRAKRAGEWVPSGFARWTRGQRPLVTPRAERAAERSEPGSGSRRALPDGRG